MKFDGVLIRLDGLSEADDRKAAAHNASKHYLQLRDEHFDRASSEIVANPKGEHLDDTGTKQAGEVHRQGHKPCEEAETDKPVKRKNPAKTSVLRGSMDDCAYLRRAGMGAEGREPDPENAGKIAICASPGPTGGPTGPDFDLQDVIVAWPELPFETRRKILKLVRDAARLEGGGR